MQDNYEWAIFTDRSSRFHVHFLDPIEVLVASIQGPAGGRWGNLLE
jgi:hypothetical protein